MSDIIIFNHIKSTYKCVNTMSTNLALGLSILKKNTSQVNKSKTDINSSSKTNNENLESKSIIEYLNINNIENKTLDNKFKYGFMMLMNQNLQWINFIIL